MRMPRSEIGDETYGEGCVLNAFVKLKKMRMARSDADPDYFHHSFRRKSSDSFNRQKKGAEFDRLEFFAQRKIDILRNVGEKPKRQVHLIASGPMNTANVRIKCGENLTD